MLWNYILLVCSLTNFVISRNIFVSPNDQRYQNFIEYAIENVDQFLEKQHPEISPEDFFDEAEKEKNFELHLDELIAEFLDHEIKIS